MARGSQPSQRQLRVGEVVRHALSHIFTRAQTNDPVLEETGVTVLEVSMSPDLKHALAYVRPLIAGREEEMMTGLRRNTKYLRKLLSPHLDLKFMPQVRFELDTASDHARRIDDILLDPKVQRDLAAPRDGTKEA